MNEPDLPSDSDISDEDYRPSGEESGAASEDESGPDDEAVDNLNDGEDGGDDSKKQPRKISKKDKRRTKKVVKRKSLKRKAPVEEITSNDSESVEEELKVNPEEQKKKADLLWADFMKDCGGPPKKKPSLGGNATNSNCSNGGLDKESVISDESSSTSLDKKITATDEKENKSVITEVFEFAGEKVSVEKEVPSDSVVSENGSTKSSVAGFAGRGRGGRGASRGGGSSALTSFLGQLGKKGKLSTLEKSKLDWDQFKKKEGIDEDIQIHNKGKDGYLERQDFLQRTDLRRFEIEKSFRQKRSGR